MDKGRSPNHGNGSSLPPLGRYSVFTPHCAKRQSATRSIKRKMRYIAKLERKIQASQTEEVFLSALLPLLQRDTDDLTAQNSELEWQLQTLELQVHLTDALNEALQEEIRRARMQIGQTIANGGPITNFPASYGGIQEDYPTSNVMNIAVQQFQQLQIHSQNQEQRSSMQPQAQARDMNLSSVPSPIQGHNASPGTSSED
ncbi:unnamed protein product [Fraxinus pennsylvanica]|uniref:BZIP transcription factor n=1 Tax=Fraxinus pennsylvanica TaxID=56036 RepID=A0AAD1Z719_9LAMI|nr:unnamed protein product [Fraxinus pennsylvanica]